MVVFIWNKNNSADLCKKHIFAKVFWSHWPLHVDSKQKKQQNPASQISLDLSTEVNRGVLQEEHQPKVLEHTTNLLHYSVHSPSCLAFVQGKKARAYEIQKWKCRSSWKTHESAIISQGNIYLLLYEKLKKKNDMVLNSIPPENIYGGLKEGGVGDWWSGLMFMWWKKSAIQTVSVIRTLPISFCLNWKSMSVLPHWDRRE